MTRFALMCASVGVFGAAALAGCGRMDGDEFREGVPRRDTVQLLVPGATAGALTVEGEVQSALLGERADTYVSTRAITAVVNGGTWAVLTLVKTIVDYPATSIEGDTAVWGPHTEALSPNTWRLTVTRVQANQFRWLLEAKAKVLPDSAFASIISGTHTAAIGLDGRPMEGFGSGSFLVDWDAAQKLPEHDDNVGKAAFVYSRPNPADAVAIDVDFTGIQDDKTGEIFNALYRYRSTPNMGGDLQYAADQDGVPGPGPTGTAKEHLTMHSRWQQDGAGRSDVQVTGGDLGATVVSGSECWDSNFASQYRNVPYDGKGTWGEETSCAFVPAAPADL